MKYFAILVSLCFFLATSAFAITTDAVKRLQSQLNYLGYNAGSVDGQYGKKTENALKEFSAQNGYKIDHFDEVALNVINNHFVDIGYDIYALLLEDDHLKNSELLKAKLPTDPRVIKDYDRFFQYRTERIPYEYSYYENWLWKEQGSDGQLLNKENCYKKLLGFEAPTTPTPRERDLTDCQNSFLTYAATDFINGRSLYAKLFLEMARSKPDNWIYKASNSRDNNPNFYHLPGIMATFYTFYAANKEFLGYSIDEQLEVETYFKRKAFSETFHRDGDGKTELCPFRNPMQLDKKIHATDNCGSVRLRFAAGELALAIVTQDTALWLKGLWDLDYALSMVNDEGFFVPLSAKGCRALGYSYDTSRLFSLNVEMLKLADFDLLGYRTRQGKTVSDAYEMLFKQYDDITISNHIAIKGIGAARCGRKPYKTHKEFLLQQFGTKTDGSLNDEWVPNMERFINWSIRFVSEERPEWLTSLNLSDIEVDPFIGNYFTVHPFEFYNANVLEEFDSVWHARTTDEEIKIQVLEAPTFENYELQKGIYYTNVQDINIRPYLNKTKVTYLTKRTLILSGDFGFGHNKAEFQEWVDVLVDRDAKEIINAKISWITEKSSKRPLSYFHAILPEAQRRCGKFEEIADDSVPFIVVSSSGAEVAKQNCYTSVFRENLKKPAFERYKQLSAASRNILEMLIQQHTSWPLIHKP